MTEDIFKAPKTRKPLGRPEYEHTGSSPPKKKKTKEDFYAFCTMILEYTQYESHRREDMRSQHNISPLDSSGSTADSYTSDTTLSAGSPSHHSLSTDIADSDDESYELITCFCMKPYGGRPMIECSVCETWIHLSCAKIRKNSIPDTFVCNNCRDNRFTKRKSSRTRVENNKFVV